MRTHLIYLLIILTGIVAFRFSDLRLKKKITHEQNENSEYQLKLHDIGTELKGYRVIGNKITISGFEHLPVIYDKNSKNELLDSKSEYLLVLYVGDNSCSSCFREEIIALKKEFENLKMKIDIVCIVSPEMAVQYEKRFFATLQVEFPVYSDVGNKIASSLECQNSVFTVLIDKNVGAILMANFGRSDKPERTFDFYQKTKAIVGIDK